MAAMVTTAAMAPLATRPSYFGPAQLDLLSPLDDPRAFALRTLRIALAWGGFSFVWQLAFQQYASLLERKGYLKREAHEPTVPRLQMLWQSLFGIAGTALPSALLQAYLGPRWTYDASLFGALLLVPYVFLYVLAFDCYYYWGHRLCHAVPWLYRTVHKKHHLPAASLDAGSTSYMSFNEGFLLSGIPFAPNILIPVLVCRGNFLVAGFNYLAVLALFYLGHTGCAIKKDILPIFLINPYLIALGVTANACRPQDHTAHHERVMCNYAVFFRLWDEMCGTAAPPAILARKGSAVALQGDGKRPRSSQPPPAVSWRVMLYNIVNFFAFFSLSLWAAGAPLAFFATLLVCCCVAPSKLFSLEAAVLRACALTRLVSRARFWDGLRRDLRVTVEEEDRAGGVGGALPLQSALSLKASLAAAAGSDDLLVAVVSLPRPASAHDLLLSAGGKAVVEDGRRARSGGGGGALGHLMSGDDDCHGQAAAAAVGPPDALSPRIPAGAHPVEGSSDGQEEEQVPPLLAEEDSLKTASSREQPPQEQEQEPQKGDAAPSHTSSRPSLYVYHPRGDMMRGAFFAFGARGSDPAHPLAQQKDVRLALPQGAARVLRLPLLRELVALLGGVDPSSVVPALKSGASVAVCLPGPVTRGKPRCQERRDSPPEFVRAALATGAALVPVVAAGEFELAGRLPLRDKMVMPSRPGCDIRVVFGEPITPTEGESAQQLRLRFASALAALAARHGAPPVEPGDV